MSLLLSQIANQTGGQLHGQDREVDLFISDSRRIHLPQRSLFIAIPGVRHDGHHHISETEEQGIRAFLVSDGSLVRKESSYVLVDDSLKAFQQIAAAHRAQFEYPVIGITGSYGKTELKERLASILGNHFHIVRSPKSYNSQTGVPLSLLAMSGEHNLGIFEAGISRPGEMDKLAEMIKPNIGIFTTIGEAHAEGFADLLSKIKEKCLLFSNADVIIYPRDESAIHDTIKTEFQGSEKMLFNWGSHPESSLHVISKESRDGIVLLDYCTGGASHQLEITSSSNASFYSAMHSLSVLHVLGLDQESIKELMGRETATMSRTEIVGTSFGKALLSDIGPIDGPSLRTAVEQLNSLIDHNGITVILMDPSESPLANDRKIKELTTELSDCRSITIGENLNALSNAVSGSVHFKTMENFIISIDDVLLSEQAIILKGPWSPELVALKSKIQEKSHLTTVTVNLESLVSNLNLYRSGLSSNTRTMAMVKAFAYGSGDAEVARILQYHKVDELAVAYADEGVNLRKHGIHLPIMVLNCSKTEFPSLVEHKLEPEIYSLNLLRAFIDFAKEKKLYSYPVHLKFDTGMHRLGIEEEEVGELIGLIEDNEFVHVRTAFSHLFSSDGEDMNLPRKQIEKFERIKDRLTSEIRHPIIFHILNSAGITRFPESCMDMVRLGIGLYGFTGDPTFSSKLLPVIGWRTMISQIKDVKAGETVGYGGSFTLANDSRIAVIPVGYADGISRLLGNGKGEVAIKGARCPFLGNICMDMSMVDISQVTCEEGDEVELIGENISIEELAASRETIPYEILTSIPPRVKRHYVFKG